MALAAERPRPCTLALDGLLVVSLEQAVAAPYCSSRLADAGARVIKIERPEGDFARFYDKAAAGLSSYFVWLNRGKQSLTADIKDPTDAALLHRILEKADVFIQNLAPGAPACAGFASDTLRAANPRLITVDISGYGDSGDYATMKAYDLLVQAESGLASIPSLATPPAPAASGPRLRHRLWHERHAGVLEASPSAASPCRRQQPQSQPVRRHGQLDERPPRCFTRAPAKPPSVSAWPIPLHLPLRRVPHRRHRLRWS